MEIASSVRTLVPNVSNLTNVSEKIENSEDLFTSHERFTLLLKCGAWLEIKQALADLSGALLISNNRKRITLQLIYNLEEVLHVAAQESEPDESIVSTVIETFRVLRNSCVGEPGNQKIITVDTEIVDETCCILKTLCSLPSREDNVTCLRVGTQCLGNLVVNNQATQPVIWSKCSNILVMLLKNEDNKVANYSSMVIYNILLGCRDIGKELDDCNETLEILIDHAIKDSDFPLFTVELLLSTEGFLPKVYHKVSDSHRLFLLEVAAHSTIPVSAVKFLAEHFKTQSDCILKTCESNAETLEPAEVSRLLQLLASSSANSIYRAELQSDMCLLIHCSMLLRAMHSLGKLGDNHFSAIQKLANLSITTQKSDVLEHPAFGFKSSLVQIIGNLCWKHTANQDQVRELDCIPVLLDCCNIDARNPLIIQWVVLAIRNLCEKNLQNQAVIGSMTQRGTINSSVLQEMGLTLHSDDNNKIVVMPLNRDTPV